MKLRKIISLFFTNIVIGLIIISYLFYSETGELPKLLKEWNHTLFAVLYANIIGFSVAFLNSLLNKIPFWRKKIGARFILGLIFNYAWILFIGYLCILIVENIAWLSFPYIAEIQDYPEVISRIYILLLVLVILLVVSDFLIYSYKYYSHGQIQNARLSRQQMELQFEALKTQLSPHYLFNSLNTISSLIYKDEKLTESYIRNLASTYKYILESDKISLITLKNEIRFIKDYCYLLDIRFGESLKVNFDIFKACESLLIPPLSIQILVENAVKHNVFDDETPLLVDVYTTNNSIVVSNKILKTPSNRESFKIGLGNIRKRYEIFTEKKVKISHDKIFKVELPLLKNENNG